MNLEKLKDTARKHEQKEDWRKAIDAYQKVIQHFDSGREADADLTIYNRVGDLYLKLNDPGSAVQSYERAAELYAEQGFLNNAIALCGKVLRVNPGRVQIYLRLAHLHARKNVVSEAKRNLIEYMERMNTSGKLDEAFAQLKVFADQHSANQDIRLMLVELLRAASRTEEAQEQLEKIASELEARGDRAGARKTRERLQHMDAADEPAPPAKGDLVFLETGFEPPHLSKRNAPTAVEEPEEALPEPEPVQGLEMVTGGAIPEEEDTQAAPVAGLDTFEPPAISTESVPADALDDLQPSTFEPSAESDEVPQLEGLVLDGAAELGQSDALADEAEAATPADAADAEFDSLDLSIEPSVDDSLSLTSTETDVEFDSPFADQGAGLDSAPSYLDDFDVGTPIELESRRDENGGLVESEEPMLPSAEAAEVAAPDFAGDAAEAPPDEPADDASIDALEERILDDPDDPVLHRTLADRLVEENDLGRAVEEFVLAIAAFEHRDEWLPALDAVDALLAVEPDAIRHQQKRVELAYRSGNRDRLLAAYLGLAEALVRAEALDKATAVYHRVLEHAPDHRAARDALAWLDQLASDLPQEDAEPASRPDTPISSGLASLEADTADEEAEAPSAGASASPADPGRPPRPDAPAGGDFIDLGSLILEAGGPRDTRIRVDGERPTGDEQKDFQETLEQFKKGIEANLGVEDYEAHYDLGIAFKEMGLLDEAIAEFQKALRAPNGRLRTSEALGVTFFEKQQYAIAETILRRAVEALPGADDEKIGLLYWLGRACEAQTKTTPARQAYERALAVDIRFMDLNDRMRRLPTGQK